MKVAIACGGTGGHIFPGLAVAEELRSRGHDVTLWLAGKGVESQSVGGWDGPIQTVAAAGFSGRSPIRAAATVIKLLAARAECIRKLTDDQPDIVLAMGSYASVGPVLAAAKLGIPAALHEANVVPGRALSFLAKHARVIAISFRHTEELLPASKCILTGFPLRQQFMREASDNRAQTRPFTVLVTGGSQGAAILNEVASTAICSLHKTGSSIKVTHLTGTADELRIRTRYQEAGVQNTTTAFREDMRTAYDEADLAICRAGAATCAELTATGLPALIVPIPRSPRDHQLLNAREMERMELAQVIEQDGLTADILANHLRDKINAHALVDRKHNAAAPADAAISIADLLEKTVGYSNGNGS